MELKHINLGVACVLAATFSTYALPQGSPTIVRAAPVTATDPVADSGDAADDPAIWVHPTDPERSLILGANKRDGLEVYSLDGRRQTSVGAGLEPNNVDVRYGIEVAGRTRDVAVATVRGTGVGLAAWWIDPVDGKLTSAGPVLPVFGGKEPYGCCLYRCARDGTLYAFATSKTGDVEQLRLSPTADGKLEAKLVRAFHVGKQLEGCVADDEWGLFYVAEEDVAIWRYGAEPGDPTAKSDRRSVARAGKRGGFKPDVEGLTLVYASDGKGALVASMQGENRFWLFDRDGDNTLRAIFDPIAGTGVDEVTGTDGVCATSCALGPRLPRGALVCQDDRSERGGQDFKVFAWHEIAGDALPVDPLWNPRQTRWLRRD
jgi:3-phytase